MNICLNELCQQSGILAEIYLVWKINGENIIYKSL